MSQIGHNSGEQIMIANQFDSVNGLISDFPLLQQWVSDELHNIIGETQVPKYYLNESSEGLTTQGVIYINFGGKEAMLDQQHDGSFKVIKWLNCNGKEIKQAA